MAKEYKVKLLRKEKLAKDTWLFVFEKPEGYVFIPGQYQSVTLTLPTGKTDWRDFTITSNPEEQELWVVTKITDTPSEFKKVLLNLPIDAEVEVVGGSGGFIIDLEEKSPYIFLAGGIGVNVFRSMLTTKKYTSVNATLIVSFSSQETGIFQKELEGVVKKQKNKKVIYHFSDKQGRISVKDIRKYLSPESIFMLAGSPEFVDAVQELLLQSGILQENIKVDYFSGC